MTPKFTITNSITNALTTIERACGFLDAATLSDDWIHGMAAKALLLEAHHTTHIEGTHLTLEQSGRLLAGESVPESDPDDARELLNYRDAFEFVSRYINDGGPVSEGLIREIHKRLVSNVRGGSARPGEYRTVQNLVVNTTTGKTIYTPPPPGDVPAQMHKLTTWLNMENNIHPVLISGIAQFQLVHIHPFLDGNGRTSRLLSTLCLYRSGYDFKHLFSISEFYDRDRSVFYAAIQGVRDKGMDFTSWLDYFTTDLATQMEETKELGIKIIKADIIVRKHQLNNRQRNILLRAMDHPLNLHILTADMPETPRRTLQRDLKTLVDKSILKTTGRTNSRRYHLITSTL